MANLLEMAINRAKATVTDVNGYAVDIELTDLNGVVVNIKGLHSKHHLFLDANGNQMSSKNANITINEDLLKNATPSYTYRDSKGEVYMYEHLVKVKDSTGLIKKYYIEQAMPNERLGIIVILLANSDD